MTIKFIVFFSNLVECWKMFISRALGYGVILGSTGGKMCVQHCVLQVV